jgi:hypothetical protein
MASLGVVCTITCECCNGYVLVAERPRLPLGAANHAVSLSNQILNELLDFSDALYADQFVVRYFVGDDLGISVSAD